MDTSKQIFSLTAKLIIGVIVIGLSLFIAPWVLYFFAIGLDVRESAREREYLLHKADHVLLLAESRKLIRDFPGEWIYIDDTRLHPIFEEIGTQQVMVETDHAVIILHGAFDHYGAYAFLEGVEPFGDQELIPGLWYVSD